ncbi:hypothetical protein NBRC110019_28010 [Neptunitalea chrysea]|uniref:DUF2147 domain-containing protein n=1 Tax=Neptunitalea chrysea TaxID=1647581 RepID=A0A9W6B8K7_9FLAO|nr:DUF2147 domain-containing protein [Neptunitalea chrysea]GLB53760.1 hypothetical protein NBRC110019_28010 [Neptunitalea chrysea]
MVLKNMVFVVLAILMVGSTYAQTVIGTWKMVDDKNGKERCVVKIYEKNDKVYGRIVELLDPEKQNAICSECDDYREGEKVEGMVVIENMEKQGDSYTGGKILNPDSGSLYRCKLWLDKNDTNKLYVRGYLAFFYRTQTWYRLN